MWRGRVPSAVRHRLLGVVLGLAVSSLAGTAAAQVQSLTAEEAGNLIRFESGVRLVLIYSTTCQPSHEMFPEVIRLSERYDPWGSASPPFNAGRATRPTAPEPSGCGRGDGSCAGPRDPRA